MTDKQLLTAAIKALELLYAEQNGPPLIHREAYWQEAMRQAEAVLATSKELEDLE